MIDFRSQQLWLTLSILMAVHRSNAQVWPSLLGNANIVLGTDLPEDYEIKDGEEFDYIVVGGGGAGCAAASRLLLSDSSRKVLLVEAGKNPSAISRIPADAQVLLGSKEDWAYKTQTNNLSCLSLPDDQCRFSRGKALGGSTSINYMIYTRGNPVDFDYNLTGWTWDEFKPYYLRYEGLRDLALLPKSSATYHNTTGIMDIGFSNDPENVYHSALLNGYMSLNFPNNSDVNAESQIGISRTVTYIYKGERMSTARAYLENAQVKKTIKIAKETLCTGVIIDNNNVAQGVTVLRKKKTLKLYAKKEVILSAGTVGTPQILMLSGIGHAEHLQSLGISVKSNLPVGDNMSDHVLAEYFIKVKRSLVASAKAIANAAADLVQWTLTRKGSMASDDLSDISSFMNSKCYDTEKKQLVNNASECNIPTAQIINAFVERGVARIGRSLVKQAYPLDDYIIDQLQNANNKYALIGMSTIVLSPYSRGYVRLASANPTDTPYIYPNYFGDKRDMEEILRISHVIEDLLETPAFKKYDGSVLRFNLENCPSYEKDRDGYFECYARHVTVSVYHAVGTCALGKVVDPELRVYNVSKLRVADLSVIPIIPRANTAATAIAVGERVVDFISKRNYG